MKVEDIERLNSLVAIRLAIDTAGFSKMSLMHKRLAMPYYGFVDVAIPDCPVVAMFSANDDFVALKILWEGCFEPASLALWSCMVEDRPHGIVDIGAYTGIYSLVAAAQSPRARILALEPIDRMYARVIVNSSANQFAERISVLRMAAGATDGIAEIRIPREDDLLPTGSSVAGLDSRPAKTVQSVSVRPADAAIGESGIKRVEAIKIDTEGFESEVLAGLGETLENSHPDMLIEILSQESLTKVHALLGPMGYRGITINDRLGTFGNVGGPSQKPQGLGNIFYSRRPRDYVTNLLEKAVDRAQRSLSRTDGKRRPETREARVIAAVQPA